LPAITRRQGFFTRGENVPKITLIQHTGDAHTLEVEAGNTVMEAAITNAIDGIIGECGGCCSCATCHCYVDEQWLDKLPARSELENEMLEFASSEARSNSRLACQVEITDELEGMVVRLPETQL
jgi:2Fe-2S ferredoxin